MQRYYHIPVFEWNRFSSVGPYIYLNRFEMFLLQRHIDWFFISCMYCVIAFARTIRSNGVFVSPTKTCSNTSQYTYIDEKRLLTSQTFSPSTLMVHDHCLVLEFHHVSTPTYHTRVV